MSIRTAISELFSPSEPTKLDLETRGNLEQPTTSLSSPEAFSLAAGTSSSNSASISERNAINITTVYSCVRVIAETIGTLPVRIKETLDTGERIANDHSLAVLFNNGPNPDMSPSVFIETLAASMAFAGNGYAQIIRDSNGIVTELYPINPLRVTPDRSPDGSLVYKVAVGQAGQTELIAAKNMLHVPLFSFDGLAGMSPVGVARQELQLSLAAQQHGERYFSNGSRPGGLLTPNGSLTPDQGRQMKAFWEGQAAGVNQGRIAILPSDWTYTPLGMSLEDSQFLETRGFERTQIAALFRVPSHMIGDSTRMSNSNHEQSSLSLIQDCLAPYMVKIEQEMQRKLLPPTGRVASVYSIKFDITERLRTDLKTTLDSLAIGRQWGFYSANDGRRILGENPIGPEGDVYLDPVNMVDAKKFMNWSPQGPSDPTATPEELLKPTEIKSHSSFVGLIRDAVGRLSTRQNRSLQTVSALFGPSLNTMAAQITAEARVSLCLTPDWAPDIPKIVAETLRSIENRSAKWTEDHDLTAADETQRTYKALRIGIFRDAATALALKDLADAA